MTDLLSKIEQVKKEAEEIKKQASNGNPSAEGDTPPENQEPGKTVIERKIPEAEPIPRKSEGDHVDYKQKYEVLQAKYDKEVPRLYAELKEEKEETKRLAATMENLNGLVKELSTKAPVKEPEKEIPKVTKYSKLDRKTFEEGGFDEGILNIIDTLNGVIEDADLLKQENAKLRTENDALKQDFTNVKDTAKRADETVTRTTEGSFWKAVNSAVPNFNKYNGDKDGNGADPKWGNFLNGFDENMIQYRVKAAKAIQTMDSDTFIEIVQKFESLNGGGTPPRKKNGLEKLITFDKGAGAGDGSGSGSGDTKIITLKDLEIAQNLMRNPDSGVTSEDVRKLVKRYQEQQNGQG